MFGNDSKPCRIYSYKARRPIVNHDRVLDQMHLAHVYGNKLIELERNRRISVEAAMRDHAPEVVRLDALIIGYNTEIDQVEAAIKLRRQQARKRVPATPEEKVLLKTLKAERKEAYIALKVARQTAFAEESPFQVELQRLDELHVVEGKRLRAENGLYWGTGGIVEAARRGDRKGAPPRFQRWTGEGAIGAQIQKGMTWEQATACTDMRLRIEILPVPTEAQIVRRKSVSPADAIRLNAFRQEIKRVDRLILAREAGHLVAPTPKGEVETWSFDLQKKLVDLTTDRKRFRDLPTHHDPKIMAMAVNERNVLDDQIRITRRLIDRIDPLKARNGGDLATLDLLRVERQILRDEFEVIRATAIERELVLPLAAPDSARSRTKFHALVSIRVGSTETRDPVWATYPVRIHRLPPPDSEIKMATLYKMRVGTRELWDFQIILARDSWVRDDHAADGVVGVDVNWRLTPAGLRVAYAVGTDGVETTCVIPRAWLKCWTKVEELQSTRDMSFDQIRAHVAAWASKAPLPDDLKERIAYVARWKSPGRLHAFYHHWKKNRVEGDEILFDEVEAWRLQDRHLHDWQASQARKIVRRRDDLYRKFARNLARRYHRGIVEDTNWAKIAELPAPDETQEDYAARIYRRIGSPGRLTTILREAFAVCDKELAENTTKNCHRCGLTNEFDASRNIMHTCTGCGAVWDQDFNASVNLLMGAAAVPEVG